MIAGQGRALADDPLDPVQEAQTPTPRAEQSFRAIIAATILKIVALSLLVLVALAL
jgi:hypothetical protein